MIKPFIRIRPDTCPRCGAERSVEAYDMYNNPIRFSYAIDRGRDISDIRIKYLECTRCRSQFPCNWVGKYPRPLNQSNYTHFMNGYKIAYKK